MPDLIYIRSRVLRVHAGLIQSAEDVHMRQFLDALSEKLLGFFGHRYQSATISFFAVLIDMIKGRLCNEMRPSAVNPALHVDHVLVTRVIDTLRNRASYGVAAALSLLLNTLSSNLELLLSLVNYCCSIVINTHPLHVLHVKHVHIVELFGDVLHATEYDHILAANRARVSAATNGSLIVIFQVVLVLLEFARLLKLCPVELLEVKHPQVVQFCTVFRFTSVNEHFVLETARSMAISWRGKIMSVPLRRFNARIEAAPFVPMDFIHGDVVGALSADETSKVENEVVLLKHYSSVSITRLNVHAVLLVAPLVPVLQVLNN